MRKLLVLLTMLALAAPLSAQWRRAALFGADVRALIVDPSNPDTLYLGTSGGEVYVSHDGAKTWASPRNGVPFPGYVVDSLLLDRTGRLWAASWGLWGGGVIAVSEDGGRTWTRRDNGLTDFSVRALAVDAHNPDFLIAGGLTGVYRTTDGGLTWEKISDQENVESVAIDPRTDERLYVGTWRQGYRTEDGGKSWKLIANGMVLDTDMFGITFNPENPDDMWVATCGWVYNTKNRGDNWIRYRDGFDNRRVQDVKISPCDKDTIFAGTVGGLYRSDDEGHNWYRVSDEDLVINTIALDPQRPHRIVLGVEGDGIYVSDDYGKTFARSCDGLRNLTVTSIAADPAASKHVYAAVAFGGVSSGIYESSDAGLTWKKVSATQLPSVLSLTINDDPETKFIAGTEKGFFWSADGANWTQAPPSSFPIRVDKVIRFNRARFFAATSEGVFTSRDAGKSWYRLADLDARAVDLALGSLGQKRALFALTANGVQVFDGEKWWTIADAPAKGRTIAVRNINDSQFVFVAGAQGVRAGRVDIDRKWHEAEAPDAQFAAVFSASDAVFLTARDQRDVLVSSGAEWQSYPLPSRTAEVSSVAVDPFDANRIYVGTLREGLFVFEGAPQKYETKPAETAAGAANGFWRQ
ncbi:MAG TPA: YCF48-related protein [Thermoanaerobaculia bacterium]|nr:YCF48-related protein [Thermoanaerobaculia bacterium]